MLEQHRTNNFDFLRILAAGMVLCSHQFALIGQSEPRPFGLLKIGTLGVLMFFSISGYLVAQSWDRDPRLLHFIVKRFLRVWPGLAAVTCVAALILGPAVTLLSIHDYLRSSETWRYFSQLYLDIQLHLPGVFEHNVINAVNGSLWTIPIEVRWYGVLAGAGLCALLRFRARFLLLLIVLLYSIYIYGIFDVQHNPVAQFLFPDFGAEYGSFFCYGAVMYRFHGEWRRYYWHLIPALILLSMALAVLNYGYAALYILLPFFVISLGLQSTPVLRRFGRYGDFSYGIYIYAFMVQQLVASNIGKNQPYWLALLASTIFTLACAFLSWHLIEQPALGLKRYLSKDRLPNESERDGRLNAVPIGITAADFGESSPVLPTELGS